MKYKETTPALRDKVRKLRLEIINNYIVTAQSKFVLIEMLNQGFYNRFYTKEDAQNTAEGTLRSLYKWESLRFNKLPTTKECLLKEIDLLEAELELWDKVKIGSSWSKTLEYVFQKIGVLVSRHNIFSDLGHRFYNKYNEKVDRELQSIFYRDQLRWFKDRYSKK